MLSASHYVCSLDTLFLHNRQHIRSIYLLLSRLKVPLALISLKGEKFSSSREKANRSLKLLFQTHFRYGALTVTGFSGIPPQLNI